jgi:acyl-coenzyme A synthetase/AMP-(fatty) acid ligase
VSFPLLVVHVHDLLFDFYNLKHSCLNPTLYYSKITVFYTAPTAIRSLMRFGDEAPNKYDLSSLKVLGTVGEPINPAGESLPLAAVHVHDSL